MKYTQQQLEEAYNQMVSERRAEENFAELAAKRISELTGRSFRCDSIKAYFYSQPSVTPYPVEHTLATSMGEYDNWDEARKLFAKFGKIDPPRRHAYRSYEMSGSFDFTEDPSFSGSTQKIFPFHVEFFDSGNW